MEAMSILWSMFCVFGIICLITCHNKMEETFSITAIVCSWMYYILLEMIGSLFASAVAIVAFNLACRQMINDMKRS